MKAAFLKRSLLAAGTVVVLGGVTLGVASAQQPPTPSPTRPPAAATPQATPQTPLPQRLQQFWDRVAAKLGVSPDRLRQAMEETRTELGLPQHKHGHASRGPRVRYSLDVAARAMNVTPEQLRQELPGKSLADVARAHSVDPARVADALKADANTRIDQAARDGRITAEQATGLKQRVQTEVDQLVARQQPVRAPRPARPAPSPSAPTTGSTRA